MSNTTKASSNPTPRTEREHGEGNYKAAREYQEAASEGADSEATRRAAREAKKAREQPKTREQLEAAERVGKSRAAEEDV